MFEVDGVILDLDDTLITEHSYVESGYRAVSRWLSPQVGIPEQNLLNRLWAIFDSKDRSRAYDALLGPMGRPDLVADAVGTYRGHEPEIVLTHEATLLLKALHPCCPVAVVTDGPAAMQDAKVQAVGLREAGIHVVLTDELGGRATWKPSPAGLLVAASILGVDPSRCVYVGDNPHKDFLAARRAGMYSIRYRTAGQLHEGCQASDGEGPDLEVTSMAGVLAALRTPCA